MATSQPYYDWLLAVEPAASEQHTPVYRSKRLSASDEAGGSSSGGAAPLTTSFRGCSTLREVFEAAVEEHGDGPLLGRRLVQPDGGPWS